MVVHQKTSTYYYTRNRMKVGTAYRLRTPKTGLGEGGGRGKRNLKANSFSVISRRLYYQVIRGVTCQRYNSSEARI